MEAQNFSNFIPASNIFQVECYHQLPTFSATPCLVNYFIAPQTLPSNSPVARSKWKIKNSRTSIKTSSTWRWHNNTSTHPFHSMLCSVVANDVKMRWEWDKQRAKRKEEKKTPKLTKIKITTHIMGTSYSKQARQQQPTKIWYI